MNEEKAERFDRTYAKRCALERRLGRTMTVLANTMNSVPRAGSGSVREMPVFKKSKQKRDDPGRANGD